MFESLFEPHMTPFTIAIGLLFGLMLLELVAALLGGSLLGMEADADVDLDLDLDAGADLDFEADFDVDADLDADMDIDTAEPSFSLAGQLGMGKAPFMVWLAALLLAFGLGGLVLQTGLTSVIGSPLPAWMAGLAMAPVGLWFTAKFSGLFARVLPKTESQAMSKNHLGRRRGVVSQGTAARGRPAEVRVQDRYGNTHYLRAEPLRDEEEIAQGTEVLVMRKSLNEGYRLIAVSE